MRHYAVASFWECYDKLPKHIQDLADRHFALLKDNPHHPSLHIKKVDRYWSVRVGLRHRALSVETEKGLIWFWIGTHAQYNNLL
ncbi:ParE family toxin-like protein [Candidatus Magnetomonas plexicatena]|uniref:ParE family toxin-like protein n=1 Tax=Candidatus Magnetomonas plexicatena TaxID=2552947 RepID=UPI001C78E4B3|nr:hypothetical protein E2O03_010605 [Nitrospirales bacterium LBB_01]